MHPNKKFNKMNLVPIDYGDQHKLQAQALFLYDLLKERDPAINISHKKVPPFFLHLQFINSKPYTVWNIVEVDGKMIGSLYLTERDEIGIFLSKEHLRAGLGGKALDLFIEQNPRPTFYANIAPGNAASKAFFDKRGFKCIQHTYAMGLGCAD